MRLPTGLLICLASLPFGAPQAGDYGPCDYNGNPDCKEIMDNTACFLEPVGADEIFKCISGGREGVCRCYGCLGYPPVGDVIAESSACAGIASTSPVRLGDVPTVTPTPTPELKYY